MTRQCGSCSLCCKLLPMSSREDAQASTAAAEMVKHHMLSLQEAASMLKTFDKPAGQRCPFQRHGKGCTIYATRPLGCRVWNCRWLASDDTVDLNRPDRAHYVIDIMPDFVTIRDDDTGEGTNVEVVQIWMDPDYLDAHRDPALRAYIERRGLDGVAAIIRFSSDKAMTLFPPSMTKDGRWIEFRHGEVQRQRTTTERIIGVARARKVKIG